MIWVVDASVALRWFLEEEAHPNAEEVLKRIVDQPTAFAVPELFAFEVFSVLIRVHPNGADVFRQGLVPLLQAGIFRQPMTTGLASLAEPFVRLGLTGYDACYAALAKDLDGIWLTFDTEAHRAIESENTSCLLSEDLPAGWWD